MLAQSFMTAGELGITEPQRDALQKTLVLLETDKLIHKDLSEVDSPRRHIPFAKRQFSYEFNMADWGFAHSCGTVCCIGGTAEFVGNLPRGNFDATDNPKLEQLFYPQISGTPYATITPAQAACALRSYLTTGDPKWSEALS